MANKNNVNQKLKLIFLTGSLYLGAMDLREKIYLKSTIEDLKKLKRKANCGQYAAACIFGTCLACNYAYFIDINNADCASKSKCFAVSLIPAYFTGWLREYSIKTLIMTSSKIEKLKRRQRELT